MLGVFFLSMNRHLNFCLSIPKKLSKANKKTETDNSKSKIYTSTSSRESGKPIRTDSLKFLPSSNTKPTKPIEKSQTYFSNMSSNNHKKHHTHEHHHFHHHSNNNVAFGSKTDNDIKSQLVSSKKTRNSKTESFLHKNLNTKSVTLNGNDYHANNEDDYDDAFSTSSISLTSEVLNENRVKRRESKTKNSQKRGSVFNKLFNQGKFKLI